MPKTNTDSRAVMQQRVDAEEIIRLGFDDADLATIISTGTTNGWRRGKLPPVRVEVLDSRVD